MKFSQSLIGLSSTLAVLQPGASVYAEDVLTMDMLVEEFAHHFLWGAEICGETDASVVRKAEGEAAIRACFAGDGYGEVTQSVIDTVNCFYGGIKAHGDALDNTDDSLALLQIPDGILSKAIVQYMKYLDGIIDRIFPLFQNPIFSKLRVDLFPCLFTDGMEIPKFLVPIVNMFDLGANLNKLALYNAVGDMLEILLIDSDAMDSAMNLFAACAKPYVYRWDSTWNLVLDSFGSKYGWRNCDENGNCEYETSIYNRGTCEELCPRLTGEQTPEVEPLSFEINLIQFMVDNVDDLTKMMNDVSTMVFEMLKVGLTNEEVFDYMCATSSTGDGSISGMWSSMSECMAYVDLGGLSATFQDALFNGPQEDIANCGLPLSKLTCPSATNSLLPFYKQDRFEASLLQAAASVDLLSMIASPLTAQIDNFATLCSRPFEEMVPPGGEGEGEGGDGMAEVDSAASVSLGASMLVASVGTLMLWRRLE